MKMKAYAKLNLLLNVHGKYFNDYHSIESIMVPLHLHDVISIDLIQNSDNILIETNNKQVPTNQDNILYKCGKIFQNRFKIPSGFKIYLEKNIPLQSGLGGESADAAAFMHYLNDHFKLNLSYSDIFYYGRLLSWDVPICYLQQYTYVNDKKSVCEYIDCNTEYYILLIQPDYGISTRDAFVELDKHIVKNMNSKPLKDALKSNQQNIGLYIHNCFIYSNPLLKQDYLKLKTYSNTLGFDGISLTGTGSCFFMITHSYDILMNGFNKLKNKYSYVHATATNLLSL